MIDIKQFLQKFNTTSIMCSEKVDDVDIACVSEQLIEAGGGLLSVSPEKVKMVWRWTENLPVEICSRFVLFDNTTIKNGVCIKDINMSLKQGATGVQILLPFIYLDDLVSIIEPVYSDVFFYKKLIITLNVVEISDFEWEHVYECVRRMRADVLCVSGGKENDFVGRVFAMFKNWDVRNDFGLFFSLDNLERQREQVYRIVENKQPEILKRLSFFVSV